MTEIGISILSSDLLNLEKEIKSIEKSKADYIHIDIMDGHFVPNLTFGPDIVAQVKRMTKIPLDVHLMIDNPARYIETFASVGADILTVHYEACNQLDEVLSLIRRHGCKPGLAIKPTTSVESIKKYLDKVSLVLQMTVEPGFGGQAFIEATLENLQMLDLHRTHHHLSYMIEVDGGINKVTGKKCVNAGADVLAVGSYYINALNREKIIQELKN
ncbi:ribulose-phosphate 3-epimerase [Marinilactibacillus psychrotolerans]|uniref:ribulose-phosphate 3-epimerase n=1 Tax=Marinilactibacillus psychrotolerans TaxID=191770 RepID=UPI001867A9C2|nr:ribulose-phosphate 3-epimerase [Marinilactibacillus psychrotolerans]